ncbi:MAG: SDR family NAD(P)-dependent oxidoreductase, partial [Wenzhouxiangellaceae bacterium]
MALVTGAAGALGEALVEGLLARGLDCVALDRNRRALERLHDRLEASDDFDRPPLVVPLDL